jgi:hypothetical protein
MKALSIMGPLVLALAFGVIAMFVGGCNPSTGGKDAGDFCEDTCAVLTVCGKIRCDSPFAAPDESDCIDFYVTTLILSCSLETLEIWIPFAPVCATRFQAK